MPRHRARSARLMLAMEREGAHRRKSPHRSSYELAVELNHAADAGPLTAGQVRALEALERGESATEARAWMEDR